MTYEITGEGRCSTYGGSLVEVIVSHWQYIGTISAGIRVYKRDNHIYIVREIRY